MQFIYACELRWPGAGDAVFERACDLTRSWPERRTGPLELEGPDGEFWPTDDVMVQWRSLGAGPNRVWRLVFEHPGEDDEWVWRTTVWIAQYVGSVAATVRIGLVATGNKLIEARPELGRPRVVEELVRELGPEADRRVLSPDPWLITERNLPELHQLVMEPDRRLPVVLVSPWSQTGRPVVDPASLATQLVGIAHVATFSSPQVTWSWTDLVSRRDSVFNGAVRLYWPGFGSEKARSSYLWMRLVIDQIESGQGFAPYLLRRLGQAAVLAVPRPALESRLRTLADDERRQVLEVRLQQARGVSDDTEWLDYFDEVLAQRDELERRVEELEDENAAVRDNFAEVAASIASMKSGTGDTAWSETDTPESVAEAMDWIEELAESAWYRGRVRVEPAALAAGRSFSSYRRPRELARAVQAVLEAGALYHDNKLGTSPGEFFSRRGFGYGAQPQPHLKVDDHTSPDQCLRVYWSQDTETRTWHITSIGAHD